jgi:hypothetical protein
MRAQLGGTGINISLSSKDKNNSGTLECRLPSYKQPVLVLHIEGHVENGPGEEPGFHIEATPVDRDPTGIERYDVYLSRERFEKLIRPNRRQIIRDENEGSFISRSKYDRIAFTYWP